MTVWQKWKGASIG
ncbi:hypothetical protein YPPY100_3266, partial [Yersinia pestis PY-100]